MLLFDTMMGKKVDRAPSVPKIWIDLAANILNQDILEVFMDPGLPARIPIEAAKKCDCDGARIFLHPSRDVREENGIYVHYKNGKRLGVVDMMGGFATICDDPDKIDFSDPETMIGCGLFKSKEPFVKDHNDLKRIRIPSKDDFNNLFGAHVENAIKIAGDICCPIGWPGECCLQACIYMLGMEEALINLISNPSLIHELMDIMNERVITQAEFLIDKGIRVLRLGDSAANMNVISPEMWRTFIKPQFTRICRSIHSYCEEAKVYCHICGNVLPVIPDLIESGIDCIAPLDTLGNVTVAKAREIAGPDFMLMGGVNTLSFINKTPDEIVKEAEQCIKEGFTNGGHYAVGSGCIVPRTATVESLKALAIASHNMRVF